MNVLYKILIKERISADEIKRASSGFTYEVYFLDNYVIKLTKDPQKFDALKKEAKFYKNCKLNFIPYYIASGTLEGYAYLIISYIEGKTLYSIWHTLTKTEQSKIISKIADTLKIFHSQSPNFLDKKFIYNNWPKYFSNALKTQEKELKNMGFNTSALSNIIKYHVPVLFKENKYGLVYNDAHFDNFIYDNGRLNLIDFDRVVYAPLDYELLIFKTMCDNPTKFASAQDEKKCQSKDYFWIYDQFKKDYKQLFNNLTDARVKLYQFNYLMQQALETNKKLWIKSLLLDLENYFINVNY